MVNKPVRHRHRKRTCKVHTQTQVHAGQDFNVTKTVLQGEANWESSAESNTAPCVGQTASGSLPSDAGSSDRSSVTAWGQEGARGGGRCKREGTCVPVRVCDSCCCLAETNTILYPLQCSCLENPRDGGAWWVAVYGVAQSRTRLKWLSNSNNTIL